MVSAKNDSVPRGPSGPLLPGERGPLSTAVLHSLRTGRPPRPTPSSAADADPWGEDLQLALYVLYELHYRGFADAVGEREWDPALLTIRGALEDRFLAALREETRGAGAEEALAALLQPGADENDGPDLGHHLARHGSLHQLREYAALRSLYHLKEADPHAWVIPRLRGQAKAAFVAVEYDEFGAGRGEDVHARLFADLMDDMGLDSTYGVYLDRAPAPMLAVVNLMSLFGLHRARRGALVGHFAQVETTSSPASRLLAAAMRRTGAGPAAERFYTEHVQADAVHEQVVRHQVVAPLLAEEPWLDADVGFGVEATDVVDARFTRALLGCWAEGRSALLPEN